MIFMIKDSKNLRFSIMTNHIQANSNSGQSLISPTRANRPLRTALRRIVASAALLLGIALPAVAQTPTTYVFYNATGGYLYNDNGTLKSSTSLQFNKSSAWIANGTMATNTGRNIKSYIDNSLFLTSQATSGNVSLTTTSSNVWFSQNSTLCRQTNNNNNNAYYAKYNNGSITIAKGTSGNRYSYYTVEISEDVAKLSDFTINSGADALSATGNYNYGHSNAQYTPAYTNYYFSYTNHYVGSNNSTLANINPTDVTTGYTWSLSDNADGYATVNANGRISVSSIPTSDITITLTCSVTNNGITKTASKSIIIQGTYPSAPIITVSGNTVTLSTNGASSFRYTLDGTNPTASTGTVYSGAIDLSSSATSPVTIKAVTVRNGNASDVTTQVATLTLPEPVINVDASAGTATITATAGATIYYTTNGTDPTTSSSQYSGTISGLATMTTIKAIAVKDGWNNSPVASKLVTIPSGVDTENKEVVLFDYEDHNWSYYQTSGNLPSGYPDILHSPDPRNVKITYKGNGQYANGNAVSGVKVGVDADANTFVYYKTLEKGTDGKYAYTTIPNPFSVRPKSGSTYYGFSHWKVTSITGGTIEGNPTTINANTEIKFVPTGTYTVNCTSIEVTLEAVWDVAEVSTNGSFSKNYGVERTFYVVSSSTTSNLPNANVACTYSSFYPDGTTNGTTAATLNDRVTRRSSFTATADSKIEYIVLYNYNGYSITGAGYNLTIGRGVSSYNNNGCATTIYGRNSNSGALSYTLRIESGTYKSFYLTGSGITFSSTLSAKCILGCDYDRAAGTNTNLYIANGEGDIYGGSTLTFSGSGNRNNLTFDWTVKSGTYHNNILGNASSGDKSIYLGSSQAGGGNLQYIGKRRITVEGGNIASIAGAMNNQSTSYAVNDGGWAVMVRMKGGTVRGSIYGAAGFAWAVGDRVMIMTGGTINGWVAGGCNGTQTGSGGTLDGDTKIYVGGNTKIVHTNEDPTIATSKGGNVFGAGSGYSADYDIGEVNNSSLVLADAAEVSRGVYGGGNYGYVGSGYKTDIYVLGGKAANVFGGANQRFGQTVNITMTGGLITDGLYGGSNVSGTINNNVTMNINGGQVGTPSKTANIHGGGYGPDTRVSQNVEITLGTTTQTTPGVTVYGDVYGGSALGYVNGTTAADTYHTYVTLNKGTIHGSLYGGGLGDGSTAANVYGPVKVTVNGGSVKKTDANGANGSGGVYGANNVNGAPQRAVTVDIYGTDPAPSENEYALFAVYGGGNAADYTYGNGYPQVTIHNCDNSIEYVYGGGNAAAVAATDVTIYGGNVIGNVFGGGNGTVTAANVNGNTVTNIYGGTIRRVFGGSNSRGTIGGTITVNAEAQTETGTNPLTGNAFQRCAIQVGELYGGGNMAASNVGSVNIGCMNNGDMIDYVYGGANQANITGNINLLMSGGRIGNLFGGNNYSGDISGSITVTVNWDGSCSNNYLGNVFGGGNLATFGTEQSPKAPTVSILNGTVSGNVYGGGKGNLVDGANRGKAGKVTGDPTVIIGDDVNVHTAIVEGDVYGGGDAADVAGVPVVTVNDCNSEVGNVYGGGNAADINGATVTINGGTIGDVFGGGHGDKDASNPSKYADVKGNVTLNIYGGTISRVFAGSNSKGEITGTSSLTVDKSGTCDMKIGEVYGGGNEASGKASSINIGCTGKWTSDHDNANNTDNRIGYELEGIGYVYGGANQADIGTAQSHSDITVDINSGIVANVFGGNNTSGTINGTITVNIEKTSESNNCSWYVGNVFGGGNLAAYTGSPAVNIKNGTVSGNVYGGGKGDPDATGNQVGVPGSITGNPVVTIGDNTEGHSSYEATVVGDVYGGGDAAKVNGNTRIEFNKGNNTAAKLFGGGNAAGVTGTATVNLSAGSVSAGVYGGCNASGSVDGTINVNITGGSTVGSANTPANVHGGGYGAGTATAGDVNVTINGANVNIYGDVYGGSGFGNVNDEITDATKVTLTAGKITGNIYGGGLGNAQNAALVNGTADVEINGGTVTGYIFGANNVNGTPLGAVTVTINGTDQPQNGYALGEVYGGGNMADYSPTVTTTPATVVVNGCDNSIEFVYGGGNAADVPATSVTIYGGTIGTVFGGGHGDKDAQTPTEANVSGDVEVIIYGGTIGKVFGGSNSKGTISGEVSVDIEKSGSCDMKIGEVYGGGNFAAGNAGSVTIGCTGTWTTTGEKNHTNANTTDNRIGYELEGIGTVFGGANNANIGTEQNSSDIELNINSGMVANVFGGNNNGGTIYGDITVNIEQTSTSCGWYVGNVYGAGNLAPYSGTPEVYIKNGKVSLNVYGGGKGASAVVTGDPAVVIGDANNAYAAIVAGDVYGGGDAAAVTGNTSVTYNDANASSYVGRLFGGGNAAGVSGTSQVTLTSGKVNGVDHGGVFGGCNSSGSVGAVTLALNGGTVGASDNTADVYGGGYGASTTTSAGITVNLNGSVVYGDLYGGSALGGVNASTNNTTTVTVSTATLHGSVFGGGKGDNNTTATSEGNAIVNIEVYDQYLTGIYGGANVRGLVKGNINVNIKANVGASGDGNSLDIFGGGYGAATNTNGSVTVTIGDEAGTYQPEIYGDIYGGSALGNVNDAAADITTVNFLNGTLHGNLYGGGLGQKNGVNGATSDIAALVKGQVVVNISSSTQTVGNCHIDLRGVTIYGCNNTNGSPQDDVTVNIYKTAHLETNGGYAIDQVFGGGNQADYAPENGLASSTKKTTVHIYGCDNTIRRVFAGGNAAAATGVASIINGGRFDDVFGGGNGEVTAANIGAGGTNLQVHGGSINRLFGGSNEKGTITGQMGVSIDSEGGCDDEMFITEFFCGNNLANIGEEGGQPVTINATIGCGTKFGSVYGGCNLATIYGSVNLTIEGGEMEYVYGGSKGSNSQAANITGNVHLIIKGGDIDNVFGGSNINGNIGGSITVDIVKDPNPCKWDIGNVYGASNLAAYTPSSSSGNYPEVNVKNGTINGSVYGGGKGGSAVVTSNPKVTIGDNVAAHCVIIAQNVYGGGDAAAVSGSTQVIYNDNNANSTVVKLFGGGNAANVSGATSVTLTSGNVTGGVYGGCNTTGSVGAVTVTLNGGQVGTDVSHRADVYGGGFGSPTTTTAGIGVELNGTTVYGDIYGGSALGKVNTSTSNTTTIDIKSNSLYGCIYGGGMGDNSNKAESNGNVIINYDNLNTNLTGLYGGANVQGVVKGNINVNINANVGSQSTPIDIFGGGLGQKTDTEGNVTVTIGKVDGSKTPTIYGDIYGGSALGNVNDAAGDLTKIDFMNGTLHGNIYGGGLGQKTPTAIAAKVNGKVQVNIGASNQSSCSIDLREANIFGGNNTNGSPQDDIEVHIYKTAHLEAANGYAINDVFGGGNQADYAPENGLASSQKKAKVFIYGCDNTVNRVFGGGNAAAAVGVQTTINGGRFNYVFGGGNGEVTAANIGDGGTNLIIHGGNINQLFGGSNASGTITGQMGVSIDSEGGCDDEMFITEFFCGNNLANIGEEGGQPVTINATIGCGTKFGSVYGGCNLATIYGSVNLTIEGGEMEYVYGGSKGSNSQAANITGNVHLIIKGGDIDNVFGGSNINGNIGGSITVDIDKANPDPCDWEIGNVYGASNLAAYTPANDGAGNKYPEVNIKNGTVGGDVFGGGYGASALATSSPQVNLIGGTVSGRIFGGGAQAPVTGSPVVTASYGSVTNIYGGGLGNTAIVTGSPSVVINQASGKTLAVTDVFGGGDAAAVTGNTTVTLTAGTVTRAFGGGNQAAISGSTTVNANGATVANIYGGGNEAGATTTNVNVSAGTVTTGVYGGSNSEGTITGAIAVSVAGGTIGSNATPANVHGGGYGHLTESEGNVSVTINGAGVNIYGDVYGGSALGNVNDATSDVTTVTLTNGTIHGSIYGGGLGDASHSALVNGAVNVIVNGGTVTDKVFGANNVNGTPKGAVTVTINGTDQPQSGYALAEVYGGGNMATYSPTVTTTPATVVVNGCNNSIGFVYGGGNAADVPATDVTIWGGTIGTVFGGGHGDKDAQTPTEANVTGNVAVKIYGGTINEVFGGSNSKGAIGGTSTVTIEDNGGSCTFDVNDVYGGGNQADGKAGTLNIGCGAVITGNIYGGAKQANVNDDIHLVISGGNLHNVFGGNNISGNVKGSIIVDIQKDNACNTWKVDNVYGGGNLAAYSVYGYNNDGTPVTEGNAVYNDPVVNIKNGTVSVNVFGGGYGSSATVYGNPHVNLIGGAVTGKVFGGGEAAPVTGSPVVAANYGSAASVFGGGLGNTAVVTGNPSVTINQTQNQTLTVTDVFGGGDAAAVNGNTTVTLTAGSVSRAFGGGNEATINGNTTVTAQGATIANIYGGGNKAGATQTSVTVSGGSVTTGVYGGSNSEGTITGAIAVSITGGTIGTDASHTANVHGGGYGSATASNGNVSVTINGNNVNIWGDVYGGSALGNVNSSSSTTTVTLEHGTIHGSLYGGGLGDASHAALVNGVVNVIVNGGTVTDKVFGANNVNGTPKGAVTVTINGTDQPQSGYALAEVYGGGNQATYSPTVTTTPATVVVNGCNNKIGVVYGGGNAADVPATDVTIWGGTIGTVFGGGHGNAPSVAANVTGNVAVKIYGGTINEVFGGSNSMGNITGSSTVTIQEHQNSTCDMSITDVYGGGNQAAGNAGTLNIGCGALITGNVYGGAKEANVNNDIHLVITGGTLNNVFGGNNVSGTIAGTIIVDINQDDNCDSWHVNNVYGGGNLAAYSAPAATKDYPVVNVMNGTISGNVFGGGLGSSAVVTANPHVNVTGGTIAGSLFGGGDEASVTGNTFISINGANAVINTKVFGGGNEAGISGNTTVTLTSGSVGNTANSGIYGGCNTSGTIGGNTYVYVVGGQVGTTTNSANVHGGGYGQNTAVSGDVTVNIGSVSGSGNSAVYSGTAMIYGSVYGGSALGTVNTDHHNGGTYNKTTVNLYGGTIDGNVYGGGLGSSSVAALVYGDVDVYQYGVGLVARYDEDDLPSSGMIFGCNNINGTPKGKVKVVVNKTVGLTGQQRSTAQQRATTTESDHHYELSAVYGGGNRAEYDPDDANGTTLVIIDGCDDISIHSVYGGGNAASTPATDVRVSGAYEIEYVFGGGNGAGKIDGNPNPGANVGYHAYPKSMAGADQVDERRASQYNYGTGVAKTEIYGGRIHKVFGGSNTLGNVRQATVAMLDEVSECPLELDGIYGGGKSAYMEGNAEIELGCVSGLDEIYGGAEQADVGSAIVLTLTSGHYNKVYGGNNLGGKILGSITVNIEQTGCLPIEIGELYLGGNNAPYSVYGYNDDNTIKESGTRIYNEPVMNLRSFKSIGTVYGGGEGAGAVLAGNPTINVNVATGWVDGQYKGTGDQDPKHIYHAAPQDLTPDGTIGAIFGGGNAAKVIGNTNINIGDQSTVEMHSLTVLKQKIEESENDKLTMGGIVFELTQDGKSITYTVQGQNSPAITKPIIQNVNGAAISGNVYGGGNQAAVTGETNVQVGPR